MCVRDDAYGRARQVTVANGATTLLAGASKDRVAIEFYCENAGEVFIINGQDASVVNGVPLHANGVVFKVTGLAAQDQWQGIGAGGAVKIGVMEYVKTPEHRSQS